VLGQFIVSAQLPAANLARVYDRNRSVPHYLIVEADEVPALAGVDSPECWYKRITGHAAPLHNSVPGIGSYSSSGCSTSNTELT
jgi:hypothetical protein